MPLWCQTHGPAVGEIDENLCVHRAHNLVGKTNNKVDDQTDTSILLS